MFKFVSLIACGAVILAGCETKQASLAVTPASAAPAAKDDVAAERAKLSAEDRALVEAQEWCVISDDERLGSMGAPIKLMIKDQAVFICCAGCKRKAESDPEKTLAKLAELKEKAKKDREAKK